MRITYPGHACLLVENRGFNFMCDPWLVGEHVNNCSVWMYPPRKAAFQDFPKFDFVYISHEHDDHCNIETLTQMPKDLPIYIMKFRDAVLQSRLKNCGMTNVHVCDPGKTYTINANTKITIFPSDEGFIDSAALIEHDGFVLFHCNDCQIYPSTLQSIAKNFPRVDMAFLPYAGFSGFPASYEFPVAIRDQLAEKKKTKAVEKFFANRDALDPVLAVPAAGDLVLVSEDLAWVNYYDRCSPDEVVERAKTRGLGSRILSMRSGDAYVRDEGFVPHPQRDEWTYSIVDQQRFARLPHIKETMDNYQAWLNDIYNPNLQQDVEAYFTAGLSRFADLAQKVGPYVLSLRTTGPMAVAVTVDFHTKTVRAGFDENYTKKMELSGEMLYRVMRQDFLWGDAYSSCRMKLDRRPPENYNLAFWHWFYSLDGLNFYNDKV